jgi:DNA modification methylase
MNVVDLYNMDCRDAMSLFLPDNSVDAIVCDPPYGLSFMGKKWDYDVPSVEIWAECLRVLKPGGHLLAFAGTRTQHRMACRIEDAGFEIRDMIAWVYGSGFPKSLDVSKAIDKVAGAEREVMGRSENGARNGSVVGLGSARSMASEFNITAPATDAARQWQGWGTVLKPALETVTFASKPYTDKQVRDIIQSNLFRLEARLWLLSSANAAGKSSTSNQSEYGAACAIAQWNADEITSTQADLCGQMGTSLFALATTTSLNIVSSWRRTLDESWSDGSTSTIETKSSTTIDWRTLKFSVSQITPASIIKACSLPGGFSANASTAESHFNASLLLLQSILTLSVTEPVISLAQHEHQGAGVTPNLDPVVLARKPLIGTVAANVLAHGTGALNIDGCRVATAENLNGGAYSNGSKDLDDATSYATGVNAGEFVQPTGRWPANLIHDGSSDVVAAFPQAKGQQGALTGSEPSSKTTNTFGEFAGRASSEPRGDTGSAARFFYAAKASKKDRDEGLDGHETVIIERSLTSESPKWGNADQQVVLQVDTEPSPPKVIAVSGVSNKSAHEWSTLLFGSEHTAPCLQGTTCIIETPTSSTTGLTTLSYFQNLLTSANTQVANCETASGGSPAQTAAPGTLLLRTTSGMMASALGVEHAASPTLLKISVSARRSDHPTVKPTDLMAYLCRLVTPPGGVVFDPFMGSGSTGKAALREGFGFIGCEMDAAYFAIAQARLAAVGCLKNR